MSKGGGNDHTPVEQPDNLKSKQILSIIDMLSEGEIEGPVNGLRSMYLNDTPIENEDGSYNFSGVNVEWTAGTQAQAPLDGFSALESEVPVSTEVTKSTPIVRTVTSQNVDRLRVTVGVSALYHAQDNGDINGSSVQLNIMLVGDNSVNQIVTINGKTRSEYLRSVTFDTLPSRPFQIRVERMTNDSTSAKLSNKTVWSSYTEIIDSKLRYPNTALCGLTFDSSQFSGVPRRNYLLRGIRVRIPSNYDPVARTYNGFWDGTFKIAWTNNPAWITHELATHDRFGLGKRLGENGMDKWTMYQIGQYCDQLVDDGLGGQEPRMTCNAVLSEPKKAREVFDQLFAIFRAMPIWNGLELSAAPDMPHDPVYRYTNANVIDGKFSYQASAIKARHTAVHVKWQDPDNGWQEQTEYVSDDALIARYGLNVKTLDSWGCTSRGQAVRAGKWLLTTEKYERYTVTFSTGREGLRHLPGDVIEVADNDRAGAQIGGRVLSFDGQRVVLDRDVVTDNKSAWFGYIDDHGQSQRISVFSQPEPNVLILDSPPSGLDAWLAWTLSTSDLKPSLWRCVDISESETGFSITALQHVPEKHDIIENGIKFDPPNNSIHGGSIPPVERLQIDATQQDEYYQARATWDTPRSVDGLSFKVKLMREGNVHLTDETDDTEFLFNNLPLGQYNLFVRGTNVMGQLGAETTVSFTIAPPVVPKDIAFETDNYTVTARPVIDGHQTLGTQYEWYFGTTQSEVTARTNRLGRGYILNHQGRKPDTTYWYGVEAVNAVGRSGLLTKSTKTTLNPDDILDLIGPEIPNLDWAKDLTQLVDNNSSKLILLEDRAALVVNNDNRVSGITVTADSPVSAIDFLADFVSFTDPDTLQRNLYWDNSRRTLVVKGELRLLDGTSISGASDIASSAGGTFRLQTSTGVFPSDSVATALFESTFHMPPNRDTVFTVYALNADGTFKNIDSKMYDGSSWVVPKLFVDGDMIALGTIKGDRFVAGTEISSPRLITPVINDPAQDKFWVDSQGNVGVEGVLKATSGEMNNVTIKENCTIEGKLTAGQIEGDIVKAYAVNIPEQRWTLVPPGSDHLFLTLNFPSEKWDRQLSLPPLYTGSQRTAGRVHLNGSYVKSQNWFGNLSDAMGMVGPAVITLPKNQANEVKLYLRNLLSNNGTPMIRLQDAVYQTFKI